MKSLVFLQSPNYKHLIKYLESTFFPHECKGFVYLIAVFISHLQLVDMWFILELMSYLSASIIKYH